MTDQKIQPPSPGAQDSAKIIRAIIGFTVYLLLTPVLLFVSAGTMNWPMGWAYVIMGWVAVVVSRLVSLLRHPDLLRERAAAGGEGAADWDRVLVPLVAFLAPMIIAVVAGLDHRYGWSTPLSPVVQYVAAFLVFVGYGVSVWAMAVNRFFSAVARVQKDRGQTVVTSGPYGIVRHPSYAGGMLAALAAPFMLSALWALLPSLLFLVPLIVRTAFEDRLLISDLEGYEEYVQRIRYRLIPGIW